MDANKRKGAGGIVRLWDAHQRPRMAVLASAPLWILLGVNPNGFASLGARVVMPAGKVPKPSRIWITITHTRKRHIHPIKATVANVDPFEGR